MKNKLLAALLISTLSVSAISTSAIAQPGRHDRYDERDYRWRGDHRNHRGDSRWDPSDNYREGRYRERRLSRKDHVYRGRDGRYYCRRNDGTTGLVIGALAGGALGNAVGGDTLGTLLGAAGGGLLGREIDRGKVKCR